MRATTVAYEVVSIRTGLAYGGTPYLHTFEERVCFFVEAKASSLAHGSWQLSMRGDLCYGEAVLRYRLMALSKSVEEREEDIGGESFFSSARERPSETEMRKKTR